MIASSAWCRLAPLLLAFITAAAVLLFGASPVSAQQCVPVGGSLTSTPWPHRMFEPSRVWPMTTGSGQRTAVIATGVDTPLYLHGQVAESVDLARRDTRLRSARKVDCLGVGTAAAGIIAARDFGGAGFRGVAPGTLILSAKVVGDQYPSDRSPRESVDPQTLSKAIDWAATRDATVIAVATITYQDSAALQKAVRRAHDRDIVIIAAVGDVTSDETEGTTIPYPAAYPDVIGVGAIAENGVAADFSRSDHVDLVAPGADVVSTRPGGGVGIGSGTALAAAYAAGAATLVRAYHPQLPRQQVAQRLFATTTPAPEGVGSARYGHGIVDPYHAVVDHVVEGVPSELQPMTRAVISDKERAIQTASQRSNALANGLAGAVAMLVVVAIGFAVFASRGRRRRWRTGIAVIPQTPPESERPEPPIELFGDRQTSSQS